MKYLFIMLIFLGSLLGKTIDCNHYQNTAEWGATCGDKDPQMMLKDYIDECKTYHYIWDKDCDGVEDSDFVAKADQNKYEYETRVTAEEVLYPSDELKQLFMGTEYNGKWVYTDTDNQVLNQYQATLITSKCPNATQIKAVMYKGKKYFYTPLCRMYFVEMNYQDTNQYYIEKKLSQTGNFILKQGKKALVAIGKKTREYINMLDNPKQAATDLTTNKIVSKVKE